jgi:hypothetical protein
MLESGGVLAALRTMAPVVTLLGAAGGGDSITAPAEPSFYSVEMVPISGQAAVTKANAVGCTPHVVLQSGRLSADHFSDRWHTDDRLSRAPCQ